ncbi:MAG: hypothetical protein IT385_17230 [Deltaproteobacteria bacterium]|nr:hypothetical protein [Deltaproteobacteria bacterium]
MIRHLIAGLTATFFATTLIACGDDETGTGDATTTTTTDTATATTATDTSTPDATADDTATSTSNTDTATSTGTTAQDTFQPPDTSGECTPDEADKGGVGAPCTKNCQCLQNLKGKPLECYAGPYMQGFSFCTRQVDNTLSEADGVESIVWISGCLTDTNLTPSTKKVYVKGCSSLSDCQALTTAYDGCGTADLEYNVGSGTECPCWNTSNGGYMSGCHMTNKSCIISTLPPFNGDYVKIP